MAKLRLFLCRYLFCQIVLPRHRGRNTERKEKRINPRISLLFKKCGKQFGKATLKSKSSRSCTRKFSLGELFFAVCMRVSRQWKPNWKFLGKIMQADCAKSENEHKEQCNDTVKYRFNRINLLFLNWQLRGKRNEDFDNK